MVEGFSSLRFILLVLKMSCYASQRVMFHSFLFVCLFVINKKRTTNQEKADEDFFRKVTFCIVGLVLIHSFFQSELKLFPMMLAYNLLVFVSLFPS